MNRFIRSFWFLALSWGGVGGALGGAIALPLEIRQDPTPYNFQSFRGVPISTNAAAPRTNIVYGTGGKPTSTNLVESASDGRMAPVNSSTGSINVPTTNQFQAMLWFGAIPGLAAGDATNSTLFSNLRAGTNPFSATVAQEMRLPVGTTNGQVALVLRRAQIGAPFFSQRISFDFGQEITPPLTMEDGATLLPTNSAYWLPQPYTTNKDNGVSLGYYWSPNAQKVYAIQAGPIAITWQKASPNSLLANYTNANGLALGIPNFLTNGASIYPLFTLSYLVSSSPVKQPQKIYWTESPFDKSGHLVDVPSGSVGAVNVVFNNRFPQYMTNLYQDPYTVPQVNPTNSLQEPRTLWFQANTIHAYNLEGRVFVEFLGEPFPDNSRRSLGFEIVDVYKEPLPVDVTVELGDRIPAYQGGVPDDSGLYPAPALLNQQKYYYQQSGPPGAPSTLYATFATTNLDDFQMHWLRPGVAGILWPYIYDRYHEVWPSDPARYSHYLRPLVTTEAQAQSTGVPLPGKEAPQIAYQDPLPTPLGAKLGANALFYTFLDQDHPAHRTLLQFMSGDQVAFERVFSWLDIGIKSNALLAGSVAVNLSAWMTNNELAFSDPTTAPYVVTNSATVGDRISPPGGELGATGSYWAGYVLQTSGNSFNPRAYLDPFAVGFTLANQGAIIPVNAIPGDNVLEVWWFRQNQADVSKGFQPSYWPTVIGHYLLQWPTNSDQDEIILARNDGTGALDSLQAKGVVYRQNDRALPGYNPNEEHALMLAGQAYALRDDLNITSNTNHEYTSDPYVLIDYTESDGRPAMHTFHVRREKPETGVLFDYVVKAGSVLQAPMPLPLLDPPVTGVGANATNYNTAPAATAGDLPVGWTSGAENSRYGNYAGFTYQDRKHDFWVYRGLHSGLPPLLSGAYDAASQSFLSLPDATAILNQPFEYDLHLSRLTESMLVNASNLPPGLVVATTNGVAIVGSPYGFPSSNYISLVIQDLADGSQVTNNLALTVLAAGAITNQGPLTITSSNQYSLATVTFTNRPPFLAEPPAPSNSFTMHFYYKTLPAFDWPSAGPPVGSIVPYLVPVGSLKDPASSNTPSLDIVYRPVWPSLVNGQPLSTLFSGETLTVPKRGMAAVRGQSSVNVLYQQSIGLDFVDAPPTVTLCDPTVQKTTTLTNGSLAGLPPGVLAQSYLGKMYFPNLPPNLKNRVFYDPLSTNLVFQGQFVDELVGEKYLLLNVLAGADLAAVQNLCPANPATTRTDWETAIDNLAASVYTFYLDSNANYVVNDNYTVTRYAGDVVTVTNSDTQVDSYALEATGPGTGYVTYIVGDGNAPAHLGEPVSMYIVRVSPALYPGQLKVILDSNPLSELISFQHTDDLAGRSASYQYDWRIAPPVDGLPPTSDPTNWPVLVQGTDLTHYTLGGSAGIQALGDNYIRLRLRSVDRLANPATTNWSDWTSPQLAEGWIKRVLAGINPFNQRTSDLFNNPVNTTASIISQAGHRWEGDVALNLDTINQFGLIEIYETVLNRGKNLSVNAGGGGINYGPANDALLLAAGYLNDLYMMIGNDAWADAANPTIGIGTADKNFGNIATALFAFKGEVASLLEEEMALLRGRDDFLSPGVTLNPVYNRLYWNYTRGIDAGEVIYAMNYNILDENNDGVVNAADAAILYPQGHGDAYGQFLTALTGYYSLLMNPNFDWVPRIEAVTVLGATVSVDYQDERKFSAAAAALARTGRQVFDLTWRQGYQPGTSGGWNSFDASTPNQQHTYAKANLTNAVTRYWGLDHWATRVGQGAYLHWLVGNAILPPVDPDPSHQGIQKVDRTTVPELAELPVTDQQLQTDMDNAEAGFTPLGLSQNSVPFDINPLEITGPNPKTHFEQIYDRAVSTLNNAVVAFDDAQNVTQLMRSDEDSLANYQAAYTNQETAYINQLIELYGTPYLDDIGPGKTYQQNYSGPDLVHYAYVENPDTNFTGVIPDNEAGQTFYVDVQNLSPGWNTSMVSDLNGLGLNLSTASNWTNNSTNSIAFNIGPDGFFDKPLNWRSSRESPGQIQQAISELIAAKNKLRKTVVSEMYDKEGLDKAMMAFNSQIAYESNSVYLQNASADLQKQVNDINEGYNVESKLVNNAQSVIAQTETALQGSVPDFLVFGLANGGDELKAAQAPAYIALFNASLALNIADAAAYIGTSAAATTYQDNMLANAKDIANAQLANDTKNLLLSLGNQELNLQGDLFTINEDLRALDDKQRAYQALLAKGNRLQQERLTFRQHAAAVIQGYRTRDAAFRIFQNEKLERYKTLFDLAAQYAFLAAQAYDYETGLLNTDQGKSFLNRIISSRALGVVANGQPQYAGSDTGDPGLSSALAEMKADWDVLKGRLGFVNPDSYHTVPSLRAENYRILPGSDGDKNWQDLLSQSRVADLLADPDIKRNCMQIDDGSGLPVPGIVLTFSTVIADGLNLFGQPLAPGDHAYSSSSFATKIFALGVDFDGYIGMDNPTGPTTNVLSNPNALAADPYVYLIPVGVDSMRAPPLGDTSGVRTWSVDDLAIPLPFNISGSDLSSLPFYTSGDSLSEPLFGVRKHQAFRPVSTTDAFTRDIYGGSGGLQPSEYSNRRLIGRSVWNSKWKLVIPGKTLLLNPSQGLDTFIRTVKDVKLYFVTYSYSGN